MKRWIALLAAVIMGGLLCACDPQPGDNIFVSERFEVVSRDNIAALDEYVIRDTETDVLYLYISGMYRAGITPLYNTDGSVMVYHQGDTNE